MKKNAILFASLLIMAIGLTSCGGGTVSKSDTPSDIVVKVYNLMDSKDYKQASSMFVNGDGEQLTEEEKTKLEGLIAMGNAQNEKKGGLKEVIIIEEKISEDGNSATVKYNILFKDGSDDDEKAKFKKADGKWYMTLSTN
ncbi:MAG: DUF4878 domain-containing protein [Bacteroidales bacterium]|nr:DUF4878 domain-containing protein [Bacteroidales bacterium]